MKIVLVRHFKVGFKWKLFYNSSEYEIDCSGYNQSPVIHKDINLGSCDRIITSTMNRALETSRLIFNREPDLSEDLLCEVPIKPFVETKIALPKRVWDIIGRLQWRFGNSKQPESFEQSKVALRNSLTRSWSNTRMLWWFVMAGSSSL